MTDGGYTLEECLELHGIRPSTGKTLYRYEDGDTYDYQRDELRLCEFPVVRETAQCYVIRRPYRYEAPWDYHNARPDQMVLKDPLGKRFAYDTKELALDSYVLRKKRAICWCKSRLDKQERMLAEAERRKSGDIPIPHPSDIGWDFRENLTF